MVWPSNCDAPLPPAGLGNCRVRGAPVETPPSFGGSSSRPGTERGGLGLRGGSGSHCKLQEWEKGKDGRAQDGALAAASPRFPPGQHSPRLLCAPWLMGVRPHSGPSPDATGPGPPPPGARLALPREAQPPAPPSPRRPGPNPTSHPRAQGLQASRRPAPPGARAVSRGALVRSARADSRRWRRAAAGSPISVLPLPGLCRIWETGGSGKGSGLHRHPLEGGLGATLP